MWREARMTRFYEVFAAVSGAVAIGLVWSRFSYVTRIDAGEHV